MVLWFRSLFRVVGRLRLSSCNSSVGRKAQTSEKKFHLRVPLITATTTSCGKEREAVFASTGIRHGLGFVGLGFRRPQKVG